MNSATPKQLDYINSLKDQREIADGSEAATALDLSRNLWAKGAFDKVAASLLIDTLRDCPRKTRPVRADPPEGMHKFGGVIFKVQRAVHGSGHLYVKALVQDADSTSGWRFAYVKGAVANLSEQTLLPLDEAQKFGQLYGVCCICGATLTDEQSIERGVGPYCVKKFS